MAPAAAAVKSACRRAPGLKPASSSSADRLRLVVRILRRVRARIEIRRGRRNRPGAELGEIAEEIVDEERHVDGVRNGAANADIRQLLAAEIEFDGVGAGVALVALGRDDEALVLAKPRHVGNRQARERTVVQFAGFHLRGRRGAIGNDAPDDAIEIGRVGAPVIRIAVGDDVLAALVFDELERAGADGREIGRVLPDVAGFIQMLRRDIAEVRQRAQQQVERHRPLVAEDRGLRIGRVDRGEKQLQRRAVVEDLLPHRSWR